MRIPRLSIGLVLAATNCTDHTFNEVDQETVLTSDVQTEMHEVDTFQFADTSFQQFYTQFISDSLFQLDNITFPISGNYRDYDHEIPWSKENWVQIKIDLENQEPTTDSLSIVQNDSVFFHGFYCLDCGFSHEMRFEKINHSWKLIYRQENNF